MKLLFRVEGVLIFLLPMTGCFYPLEGFNSKEKDLTEIFMCYYSMDMNVKSFSFKFVIQLLVKRVLKVACSKGFLIKGKA